MERAWKRDNARVSACVVPGNLGQVKSKFHKGCGKRDSFPHGTRQREEKMSSSKSANKMQEEGAHLDKVVTPAKENDNDGGSGTGENTKIATHLST